MYFHQKVNHLVDHVADWLTAKLKWWLPSIGAAAALSLFLLAQGGPEGGLQQVASVVMPVLMPITEPPMFGAQMPEREASPGMEDEEEDD